MGSVEVGELKIEHPRRLSENQSRPVVFCYEAAAEWRPNFATGSDIGIEAQLSVVRLRHRPQAVPRVFRNDLIARTGADSQACEVVPIQEGDYMLGLRLDVRPVGFTVGAIDVNSVAVGEASAAGGQRLPVTVDTRYSVPQATVDLMMVVMRLVGFMITSAGLPFVVRVFRRSLHGLPSPQEKSRRPSR